MEVIDNFLPSYYLKQIQSSLMDDRFAWFYNQTTTSFGVARPRYTHMIYRDPEVGSPSKYFSLFDIFREKIGVIKWYRIMVNSMLPSFLFSRNTGFHIDGFPCSKTAIYYLNTNNGYTKFKGHGKVECVENRMVIFDSNLKHAAFTSTESRRITVNFNYEG